MQGILGQAWASSRIPHAWMDNSRYTKSQLWKCRAMLSMKPFYRLCLFSSSCLENYCIESSPTPGDNTEIGYEFWRYCLCRHAEGLLLRGLSSAFTGTFPLWSSLSFTSSLSLARPLSLRFLAPLFRSLCSTSSCLSFLGSSATSCSCASLTALLN